MSALSAMLYAAALASVQPVTALSTQDMTQAEMIDEAEDIGRSAAAMGACSVFGYTVHGDTGSRWADEFGERAEKSGWSSDVVESAINAGVAAETSELKIQPPIEGATVEALRSYASSLVERVKARCRRLAQEHAGLISDLNAGDQNADAQLAILIQPLKR